MNLDKLFWCLLPFFILISGNFSPLKLGPIQPIYLLFLFYVLVNINFFISFFSKRKITIITLIALIIFLGLRIVFSVGDFDIHWDVFKGAINPFLYGSATILRYVLAIFVLIIFSNNKNHNMKLIFNSFLITYFILLASLLIQVVMFYFYGLEFGYITPVDGGVRYGGLIGEPQTLSAWLFSLFYFIYIYSFGKKIVFSTKSLILILSQVFVLFLTESTAWFFALLLFFYLFSGRSFKYLIPLMLFLYASISGSQIYDKVIAELFFVSERSVTIIAGYQLFSKSITNSLFGIGAGMTPYLITSADIFNSYPNLNLAEYGRQNIMNSYLDIFFEFGIIGSIVFIKLFISAANIKIKDFYLFLPIFAGIFSVGAGLVSGYFLLTVPIITYYLRRILG